MLRALVVVVLMAFGTAGQAQMIDDFESYADTAALKAAWQYANLLDETTPNPGTGTKSFLRSCLSVSGGGCGSPRAFDPALDLRDGELTVWYKPLEGGPAPYDVFVILEDGSAGFCQFRLEGVAPTAWARLDFWPDSVVDCPSLDASDVVEIWLSVQQVSGSPDVVLLTMNWDDLQFWPSVFASGFEESGTAEWSAVVSGSP